MLISHSVPFSKHVFPQISKAFEIEHYVNPVLKEFFKAQRLAAVWLGIWGPKIKKRRKKKKKPVERQQGVCLRVEVSVL